MTLKKRMDLTPMLKPKSVAIIGASRSPEKVGHIIMQNYMAAGYAGKLYPVNKNADSILGFKAYATVLDIKESVDLAVIAIPAEAVPEALEECGKAHVKSAVVISGGFAEIGNKDLQDRITEIAMKYRMPLLGPNCLGVMDTRSRIDTLFLPTYKISRPPVGNVSFVSQSGAVGSTVLDVIAGEGFGLSKFISYGNGAYADEVDLLHYLMDDPETDVVILYLEGIKRGKEFVEVAREITKKKPVVVLKAGRTQAGSAAAKSHTASLAGNYAANEAVFKQFGFTIANDLNERVYYAKIFASQPKPKGNRVAIITNGGGAGVITTDALASSKCLALGEFGSKTKTELRKAMPPLVNITNPLDLAGDADFARYESALTMTMADDNIDMLVVIVLFQTPGADSKLAAELMRMKETTDKPLVVISIGSNFTQMHKEMMESSGLPVYDSPYEAVRSLEELYKYGAYINSTK